MKCQKCGERDAAIQITHRHSDGKEERVLLCHPCAQEVGLKLPDLQGKAAQALEGAEGNPLEIVNNLVQQYFGFAGNEWTSSKKKIKRCGNCGLRMDEFRSKGLFGCPHCYSAFCEELDPIFQRVQMGNRHKGRAPGGSTTVDAGAKETSQRAAAESPAQTDKKVKTEDSVSGIEENAKPGVVARKAAGLPKEKTKSEDASQKKTKIKSEELETDEDEIAALERLHTRNQVEEKEAALKAAIAEEDYGRAAALRDELRGLRENLGKGESK